MNLTSPPTAITATATATTPETDTETPSPTKLSDHHHPTKILSFTNGALKHHHHSSAAALTQSPAVYKECLKNHAASLGGHALDGCGEFMPSPTAIASDPTSLKCAACGCHRNFHRREPEDGAGGGTHIVEYIPHPHPVLPPRGRSPSSASPPPISSSYYPSAPHMLLALSTGGNKHENSHGAGAGAVNNNNSNGNVNGGGNAATTGSGGGRKRFRTKFSQEQKEKMLSFSERLGWKMQKRDEGLVEEFCNEVGVGKGVLKVWMHNNKHTFAAKRSDVNSGSSTDDQPPPPPHLLLHGNNPNTINNNNSNTVTGHDHNHHISVRGHVVSNNGSSSSS